MDKNDQAPEATCELKLFGDDKKPSTPDARLSSREAGAPFEEQSRRPWCGARSIEADLQRNVSKKLLTEGLLRRTRSGSGGGAGLAADLCGESDLTAEHHIGEESSSNYHDHGSSMVEVGEESPFAISNAQFRPGLQLTSGQSLQLNSDSANGGGVIRPFPIPGAVRLQARLVTQPISLPSGVPASSHGIQGIGDGKLQMIKDGISIAHAIMEPAAAAAPPSNRPGSCSTAQQSSVTSSSSESPHGTGRDWLQLCVGSSLNGDIRKLGRPDSDVELDAHHLGRGRNDDGFGLEAAEHPTGISNSVSAPWDGAIEPDRSTSQTKKPSPWHDNIQAQISISTSGAPPKVSGILRSAPASNAVQNGVGYLEAGPNLPAGTTNSNVGPFGNAATNASPLSGGAASPGARFFSQPGSGVTARVVSSNAAEHSFSSHGEAPELRGSFLRYNGGDHGVSNVVQNQYGPTALWKGGVDDHGKGGAAHAVNLPIDRRSVVHSQRDGSQQHSLGDWIQAQGKLSHNGDGRHAWLPVGSGQHFFISPTNSFEVQNMASPPFPGVSQLKDVPAFSSAEVFRGDDNNASPSFPFDTHHQHQQHHQNPLNSDDWERLRRKVGPSMVFQSQTFPFHEGATSTGMIHNLARSNSKCSELRSTDSEDKITALKAAFETVQGNSSSQMQAPEGFNLIRPAAWWPSSHQVGGGGHPQPLVRPNSAPEAFTSLEREVHPSFLSERFQLQQADQRSNVLAEHACNPSIPRQQAPVLVHKPDFQQGYWNALQRVPPSVPAMAVPAKRPMLLPQSNGDSKDARHAGLWFKLRSGETQGEERGLPQISKAYLRIRDGKMLVSTVKKYLVSKLGLASEAEVDITCKGQLVVSSLSLQHVRDAIWFSNRSKSADFQHAEASPPVPIASELPSPPRLDRSSMESSIPRNITHELSENGDHGGHGVLPPAAATSATAAKDIVMVLMYRRHHPSNSGALQLSNFLT